MTIGYASVSTEGQNINFQVEAHERRYDIYFSIHRQGGYQLYQEKHSFHWDFTEKIDSINNILVQQAFVVFGGRRWVAWFTPNIPITAGP